MPFEGVDAVDKEDIQLVAPHILSWAFKGQMTNVFCLYTYPVMGIPRTGKEKRCEEFFEGQLFKQGLD